jgi:hypothetical protein
VEVTSPDLLSFVTTLSRVLGMPELSYAQRRAVGIVAARGEDMLTFGGITHIIKNPAGTYSLVGSVPLAASEALRGNDARRTVAGTIAVAVANGATLCEMPDCACRKLFPVGGAQ